MIEGSTKKVIIISNSASFPWGMASTNRVKLIAKGLIHYGHELSYIGITGANTEKSENKKWRGIYDGVKYFYPGLFSVRPVNWVARRIDDLLSKYLSILYIVFLKISNNVDVIILYTRNYKLVKYWSILSKLFGIKIILEICEWPIVYQDKINKENSELYCNKAPLLVDGVIPISQFIENEIHKISTKNRKNIPSFKVPILIDIKDFNYTKNYSITNESYMLYSGSIAYSDIFRHIIDAMILMKADGYNYKLKITGGGDSQKILQLKKYIKNNNIEELIEFTGYLNEESFIQLLQNACLLLAPIPDNMQTKARFPTKLGSYLASGNPVITNPFGEVGNYLTDNDTAYLVDKFDSQLLKDKIIFAMQNGDTSKRVGINGKRLAFREFDYRKKMRDLNKLLMSIK